MSDDPKQPEDDVKQPPADEAPAAPAPEAQAKPWAFSWRVATEDPGAGPRRDNGRHIVAFVEVRMDSYLTSAAILAAQFLGGETKDENIARKAFMKHALRVFDQTVKRYTARSIKLSIRDAFRRNRGRTKKVGGPAAGDPA